MGETTTLEYAFPMQHQLAIATLPALMIIAAVHDCANFRIPNWLTGLTALLFFPAAWFMGMPLVEFGWHLLAGLLLFFAGYGLFAAGLFGGGDAKLMAAAGLWFGTSHSMSFLIMTALAGGIVALAYASWACATLSWDLGAEERGKGLRAMLGRVSPQLPYGLALAIGAILAFPQTWWMNNA